MFKQSNLKDLDDFDPFDGTKNSYIAEKTPTRTRRNRFDNFNEQMTTDFESFLKLPGKGDILTSLPNSPGVPLVASTPATRFIDRPTKNNVFAGPELTPRARRALARSAKASSPLSHQPGASSALNFIRKARNVPLVTRTPQNIPRARPDDMEVDDDADEFVVAPSSFFLHSVKKAKQYFGRISSAISPFVSSKAAFVAPDSVKQPKKTRVSQLVAHDHGPVRRSPRLVQRQYKEHETISYELQTAQRKAVGKHNGTLSFGLLDLFLVFPIKFIYFVLNCLVSVVKTAELQFFRILPAPYKVREVFSGWFASALGSLLAQLILGLQFVGRFLQQPFGVRSILVVGTCIALYYVQFRAGLFSAETAARVGESMPQREANQNEDIRKWNLDSGIWEELQARVVFREDWEQQLIMLRAKQQSLQSDISKIGQHVDSSLKEQNKRIGDLATSQIAIAKNLDEFRKIYDRTVQKLAMRDAVPSWDKFLAANRDELVKLVASEIPNVASIASETAESVVEAAVAFSISQQMLKRSVADLGSYGSDFAHVSQGGKVIQPLTSASVNVGAPPQKSAFGSGAAGLLSLFGFTFEKNADLQWHSAGNSNLATRAAHEALSGPNYWVGKRPGQCWPLAGSEGSLGVHIAQTIYPSAFTLEHISPETSPVGDAGLSSAPRRVQVYGIYNLQSFMDSDLGNLIDNKDLLKLPHGEPVSGILLAEHEYNPFNPHTAKLSGVSQTQPPNFQTFSLLESAQQLLVRHGPLQNYLFKIRSNWGRPEFTCLYRARIHGEAFSNKPTPSRTLHDI